MKENQNLLFKELWMREVKKRIQKETKTFVDKVYYGVGVFFPFGEGERPVPSSVMEWIKNNPAPKHNEREFIRELHNRVLAIETALAEKGGEK